MNRPPRLIWFSLLILTFATIAAGCREEDPTPTAIAPTPTPKPVLIGLSDNASTIEEIVTSKYPEGSGDQIIQFVRDNRQNLLMDLTNGAIDAAILHMPEEDPSWWTNPIAMDGLAIIVHASNPIRDIRISDLQELFSGRIRSWSELEGNTNSVDIMIPVPGSGTLENFQDIVMVDSEITGRAQVVSSDQTLQQKVITDPSAVGISMVGLAGQGVPLSVEGIEPTEENLNNQDYPLVIPLYMVSRNEPEGEIRRLLAWLQSEQGQTLLSEYYGRVR
jgi:ABC-type phosphate transport system substrate-binding protein